MQISSMNRILGLLLGTGALLAGTTGCELISAVDRSKIEGEGGGGAGGGGAGGATGGTGGTTTMAECTVAGDCPDPGNECLERACDGGKCAPSPVAQGTPLAAQSSGDCQTAVCDGNGATTSEADDADVPADGLECTDDVCTAGVPSNPPVAADTACGAGGALYCDGNGKCVGCTTDAQCGATTDCQAPSCDAGACAPNFVAPGTPILMQADGDCMTVQCDGIGGTKILEDKTDIVDDGKACTEDVCTGGMATHPNSASGKACAENGGTRCDGAGKCVECITGADCASLVCQLQVCIAPTCMDGVKNATETDVDCGGPDCAPCAVGQLCSAPSDCLTALCSGTPATCQPPACDDMAQNGAETDVDCGGAACPACGPGLACVIDSDCAGGSCVGNTCVPTCTDGIQNNGESDVDCGGAACATCGQGKACTVSSDCTGGDCTGAVCGDPDDEPANNACDGAALVAAPAMIAPLELTDTLDVDWFRFEANASDVGKVVHVVTTSTGTPPCDTVVEVFSGATCAAATSLGGPSDDANYSENWMSDPIPAAGPFWVQVTYSTFGFSSAPYTLFVTLE